MVLVVPVVVPNDKGEPVSKEIMLLILDFVSRPELMRQFIEPVYDQDFIMEGVCVVVPLFINAYSLLTGGCYSMQFSVHGVRVFLFSLTWSRFRECCGKASFTCQIHGRKP